MGWIHHQHYCTYFLMDSFTTHKVVLVYNLVLD